MSEQESETGDGSPAPQRKAESQNAGQEPERNAEPTSRSKFARAAVPLAIVVGAGALVYTLTTPERAVQLNAAEKSSDCDALLESTSKALALNEIVGARQSLSKATPECLARSDWQGTRAELLVLEGQVADGKALAKVALQSEPKLLSARRVACLSLLQAAESEAASACLAKLLNEAPDDLGSVFHAARAAQLANVYRNAREGYLKALRLEPKHVEARFRLVEITHAIGAKAESENHLKKLASIARADDPRLARARQFMESAKAAAGAPAPSR